MAGASTPLTPAGTLALLNAELLPVWSSVRPSKRVRRSCSECCGLLRHARAVEFYDPQSVLISVACSEMMAHYGIPHCSTSGSAPAGA